MQDQVYITDFITDGGQLERDILVDTASIEAIDAKSEEELLPRIADASALIVWHIVRLTEKTLSQLPKCKVIVRCGSGYDNVDGEAAKRYGIKLCNNPDYGVEEVSEHAIALTLMLTKKIEPMTRTLREKGREAWTWRRAEPLARNSGKTFGVLGFSGIGMATAMRAKAFGWNVIFCDPFVKSGLDKALHMRRVGFDELLAQSDVLSLHANLSRATHHIVDAKALAAMKPGSYLINTGRGGLVDENALLDALRARHLAGAGLDVMEKEPATDESLLFAAWRAGELDNVIITPHMAFYSEEGLYEQRSKPAEEVRRVLRGERPLNWVNP